MTSPALRVCPAFLLSIFAAGAAAAPARPADAGASVITADDMPMPPPGGTTTQTRVLSFERGAPAIPVRLMEGQETVAFVGKGRVRIRLHGTPEKTLESAPGALWTAKIVKSTPGRVRARMQLAEFPLSDKLGLEEAIAEWSAKGLPVTTRTLGGMFGISGKVIDNRRTLLLVDEPWKSPEELKDRQAEIVRAYAVRTSLFEIEDAPATGEIDLFDAQGVRVASATNGIDVESVDGTPLSVRRVEFGVGYDFHGFEDRSFRGTLRLRFDRKGTIAVINVANIEDVLRGLVPSEIFARAHVEALKAQAVTARGELLAKVGLKHLADPYLLCSEQHCAVYRGLSGETPTTNAAVEATAGEALFDSDGRLVDSVYSAICGGHTENNEVVWGGTPNRSLRGRPDTLPGPVPPPPDAGVAAFLKTNAKFACQATAFASPSKFRWERRFTSKDVNDFTRSLGLGDIYGMTVQERGVSGRVRLLNLSGELGATQVRGELNIRKLFGMLNSAMFEVRMEKDKKGRPAWWVFTGGGWGHGVGMCQMGAIGRAESGEPYRAILKHYFNGAEVARLY